MDISLCSTYHHVCIMEPEKLLHLTDHEDILFWWSSIQEAYFCKRFTLMQVEITLVIKMSLSHILKMLSQEFLNNKFSRWRRSLIQWMGWLALKLAHICMLSTVSVAHIWLILILFYDIQIIIFKPTTEPISNMTRTQVDWSTARRYSGLT